MTKKHFSSFMLIFLAASVTGCVPVIGTERPGVSGTLIDPKTSSHVANAQVSLRTNAYGKDLQKSASTISDANGQFRIPPVQELSVYIVPMDPLPWTGVVTIKAAGYREISKSFPTSAYGPGMTELGSIYMEALEK